MNRLFKIFRESAIAWNGRVEDFWPFPDVGVVSCTFINHYSLDVGTKSGVPFSSFNYLFADGALLASQATRAVSAEVPRVSFDLSSVACEWLAQAGRRGYKVILIGGSSEEAFSFLKWVKENVRALNSTNFSVRDGFSGLTSEKLAEELIDGSSYFIVLGLGTPTQERFALDLVNKIEKRNITAVVTTCGGFITQTAMSGGNFYPKWIDLLGLRWLWRCYKQPYVLSRLLRVYPRSYLEVRKAISNINK